MYGNIEAFRLTKELTSDTETSNPVSSVLTYPKEPTHRRAQRFLKGPIQLSWLKKAAECPGKNPLLLALALCYQAGLSRSKAELRLTSKLKREFGIPDRSARQALQQLEAAGLVQVERNPGRCLTVTILDVK